MNTLRNTSAQIIKTIFFALCLFVLDMSAGAETKDSDSDGFSNGAEQYLDSNANDALSTPKSITLVNVNFENG